MRTRSHEYARAITLSQCDLYTGGGVGSVGGTYVR